MNSYVETKDKETYEKNNILNSCEKTKNLATNLKCLKETESDTIKTKTLKKIMLDIYKDNNELLKDIKNNEFNFYKLDKKTLKKQISKQIPKEYTVIDYSITQNDVLLTLKHKECNYEFNVGYRNIKTKLKNLCPICSKIETKEKIKLELDIIYNEEYELIDIKNYNSYNKILIIKHKKCNKEIRISYPEILQLKLYCPNCNNKILEEDKDKYNIKNTKENIQLKNSIEKELNNEFEITGIFTGNKKHLVEMKHNCGYEGLLSPYNLIRKETKNKCPECDRKRRESIFLEKINNRFEMLSQYNGLDSMIKVKNLNCGHIYKVKGNYLVDDRYSCPECKDIEKLIKIQEKLKRLNGDKFILINTTLPKKQDFLEVKCKDCGEIKKIKLSDISNSRKSICYSCVDIAKNNRFREKIANKFGEDYKVIGNYINESVPIEIEHTTCGNIMKNKPKNFLNIKTKCTFCESNLKRNTQNLKNEITELTNGEFILRSEYKNNYTKILIKHNKCDKVFNARVNTFLKKPKCPHCDGKGGSLSQQEFITRINNKYKGEYRIIGSYTSRRGTVEMIHTKCNELFITEARKPLSWSVNTILCPNCSDKMNIFSNTEKQEFMKKFNDKLGDDYSIISEVSNRVEPIKIKHLECGHEFEATPTKIFSKTVLCQKCKRDSEKFLKILNNKIEKATQGEIELVGEYKGMNKYNTFIHKKCGTKFEKRLNSILEYRIEHCPKCNDKK